MGLPTNPLPDWLIKLITQVIKDQLSYLVYYEKKVEELESRVVELQQKRERVNDKVAEEKGRYGREIYEDVTEWLDGVDKIISEYESFNREDDHDHARCSLGILPNPAIRYRCSKIADHIKGKVDGLLQTIKLDNISRRGGPPSMGFVYSSVDYQSYDSRTGTMNKIMEALENSSARMIGIYGPTGVGKTTLVIEAAKMAHDKKLFDLVIMARVTKSPDIRKIQGQIADMLGMKLEEESEEGRAARIRERLKNKKNTLMVLDDLCAKVDLNMLGIPSEIHNGGNGREKNLILKEGKSFASGAHNKMEIKQPSGPGAMKTEKTSGAMKAENTSGASVPSSKLNAEEFYRGCKVLFISEVRQVLNHMDVEARSIVSVNVLNDKEAETLFKKVAGIGEKSSEFGKLATQIAKKCDGLPMSIVTTARALKNQSHLVWEVTNRDLESQKLIGTPEYSTKLSYKLLQNEELKITFLLCAQMGHDALVTDLVKYCIGLGFLQGIYTVSEARDRVQAMLVKLKQSGLLSESYSSDRFTMQNLVRSAALSIASEDSHVFTLIEGKLEEWPDEDKLQRYTAISLRHCDVIEKFPKSINCPILRIFQVDNNDPHLKIPNNFFRQMKELRVLILTGIHLSPLPSSIRCLTKLRMLCLEQCTLAEKLCIIGKLKNLRILSFSGSDIESLPVELKQLTKLQIFDISNCSKLRVIPPNVISSLTSLEELYMRNTSVQWRVDEGQKSQNENASLSELGNLNQLTNLDIQIPSVAHLPKNLFFDSLYNYKIVIGSSNRYLERDFKMPEKYELSRFLVIQQKDVFDIHSQKGIKMLFERVEILLLEKLNCVQDIFYALNLKGFPCLQHLSIVSSSSIESLINPKDRKYPEKAFLKLESLHLYKLKKMEEICPSSCQLSAPSFGILKIIKIELCGQLKNVFLFSMAKLLTALETIQVCECNSLKEIVRVETQNANEVKLLEFSKLCSLTLQSLPEFIGFIPSSPGTRILFNEKVKVSNLERMELSLIQVDKICNDQCSHFENLIHLDVNGCSNLTYLLSFHMAKNLVKLQNLFVSECEKMEHLFFQGQDNDPNMKLDNIFPNLKNIKLSSMKSLSEIWSSKVPSSSFGKLDTLIIEKCDKFVNVFPRYMVGIFKTLGSLRVTNCRSMEAIFDLADPKRGLLTGYATNLQDLRLEILPKLKHVLKWEKDQEGILDLKNLQKIWVQDCDNLENIFPIFIAEHLKKLEDLTLWDCSRLREIVAKGEDINSPTSFEFPRLTTIKFLKLPKFNSFYPGAYELSCPKLNDLSVEFCDMLELFREETSDAQRKPILFPEEVINNLKSMQIEFWDAKLSTNYYYRRDNLEELRLSGLKNIDILYSFLHHNPNLKSLCLNSCNFEELVPLERPPKIESLGVVPKLKSLKLTDLYRLKKIGFDRDAVLQRIELLILKKCPYLDTIAPSSVSLIHLTNLEVVDCKGLKYLMTLSTAKSLGQLRTMKVINCESLEEIVSEQQSEGEESAQVAEEGEEKNAGKVNNIVVRQLKALELVSLKNLKSFCSSKSCVFEFPSLEKVVVSACPKMENFSQEVESMPILQKIYVVHENEKKWCWEGNLQATIQYMFHNKKFFEGMDELSVSQHLDIEKVWNGEGVLRKDWLYSLKILKLERCKFDSYAIPSNVLRCLKCLKELEVIGCDNITGIFEMDDTKSRETSFQLKKLTLILLPNVTHVWQQDKQGISGFHNLQLVTVYDCKELKTLFPAALAKNLKKLEELEVTHCSQFLKIVAKEKEAAEGTQKFVFPHLTKLKLFKLPQLTNSERFTLECPELSVLSMTDCNNFELFQSQQEAHDNGQPLFSDIKGFSKVENLDLNRKDTLALGSLLGQTTDHDLEYLYKLLMRFKDDDVNGSTTLPIEILEKAPNLEMVGISDCRSIKELVPSHRTGKDGMLRNLKELQLYTLYELHSVSGLACSSKLQRLFVYQCPRLTTLVLQSCSNLRDLQITECSALQGLFTSSTARMLIHLEELRIECCKSIKEIVGKEQDDETDTGEIEFERLERISLQYLSSLECFYSGNATLKLPSLIRVDINGCHKMNTFSEGLVHAGSSRGVQVSHDFFRDLVFHGDLNALIVGRLIRYETDLVLADHPELKIIWLGRVPITSNWPFNKLTSFVVDGCEFLSNVVIPSHLLPFLSNLELLVVRNCDYVEAIFDVKDTPTHYLNMIVIPLKKLFLEELPSLMHIWNEDPKGILSLPVPMELVLKSLHNLNSIGLEKSWMTPLLENLEDLTVYECNCLTNLAPSTVSFSYLSQLTVMHCDRLVYLFTFSTAKSLVALKIICIHNCESLEKVVAAEEGDKPDEDLIFSNLKELSLSMLPNLGSFYTGNSTLSFPCLHLVGFDECKNMINFSHGNLLAPCLDIVQIDGIDCNGDLNAVLVGRFLLDETDLVLADHPELKRIWLGRVPITSNWPFNKLRYIRVDGCEFLSNVVIPSHLLPFLSNLEMLVVRKCDYVEAIFDVKDTPTHYLNMIVIPLKKLILEELPSLMHIWNEDPKGILSLPVPMELWLKRLHNLNSLGLEWMSPLLENLEYLNVYECSCLTNLAPSTVSFSYLSQLTVMHCDRLEYLFTSSTAKSLVALKTILIHNCESLEKVVAAEEGDKPDEDLIFSNLKELLLSMLPKLGSFYTGNSTLSFPCLHLVGFEECKNMKTFSHGNLLAPCLDTVEIDGIDCNGDLNTVVGQQFDKGSGLELA